MNDRTAEEWIEHLNTFRRSLGLYPLTLEDEGEGEPDFEGIMEARRADPDPDFHNSNFYDIHTDRR